MGVASERTGSYTGSFAVVAFDHKDSPVVAFEYTDSFAVAFDHKGSFVVAFERMGSFAVASDYTDSSMAVVRMGS